MLKPTMLLLCLAVSHTALKAQSLKDSLLDDIQTYSPISFALLEAHDALESSYDYSNNGATISTVQNTDTYEFMNWDNYDAALFAMSINIHEICHSYMHYIPFWEMEACACGVADLDVVHQGFYISPEENLWIQVDKSLLFPSRKLIPYIPESRRTFRYKTYIVGEQSAQGHGIIGLMDEFNAYYIGAKYSFDMLPVYQREDPEWGYVWWSNKMKSLMAAYFEFDFYIKEYLLYAQKSRPKTYDYLKNDLSFLNIYNTIQTRYADLLTIYEKQYQRHYDKNSANTDSFRWTMDEYPFGDEYKVLQKALSSLEYSAIQEDFGVK